MSVDLAHLADVLLNVTTVVGFVLDIPIFLLVLREASKPPRNWALILMAYVLGGIAALVLYAGWAATNRAAGYPVPQETALAIFRAIALYLAMFAPLYIWVRLTGRFRSTGA